VKSISPAFDRTKLLCKFRIQNLCLYYCTAFA
jgi:hypothetical protein